jgi:hypothetical protein
MLVKYGWMKSWEVLLGAVLLLSGPVWSGAGHFVTASDGALWFGGIVLGSGLLRDLWALWVTRPKAGDQEVAMCLESMVGVAAIALGLMVLLLPVSQGAMVRPGLLAAGVGFSFMFAGWVHDLVVVRRGKHLQWLRAPDHGSFVVHLLRGRGKECLTGAESPADTV